MISTFDVETSFQITEDNKLDPSPKNPDNFLVSLGINDEYIFFKHREYKGIPNRKIIQDILDKTTLLIGHNTKFDLLWLWEVGFNYTGRVYDTMIGEYVMNKGIKRSLKLKDCCAFRGVIQKSDATEQYIKDKVSFQNIPIRIVEDYGRLDVKATRSLFDAQMLQLKKPQHKHLVKTLQNMCHFLVVLAKMENHGIYIDMEALDEVEKDFQEEYDRLRVEIDEIIYTRMGDTKINPASPEQLSWLIYGRKVKDKKQWANFFNIGIDPFTKRSKKRPRLSKIQFDMALRTYTKDIYRTKAAQCSDCTGKGVYQKYKVNGDPYKNLTKCDTCSGQGVIYHNEDKLAGFRQKPRGIMDTSEGGFKTDKVTLMKLLDNAKPDLVDFIKAIIRYSAVDMYLKTFVTGISNHTDSNGFLHPKFMQCVTSTGRLSSRDPNFQNQPRGGTFPIRKVVKSRFKDGVIIEIDFAQLEFRTAVFLAQDKQGMEDIKNGVDVHQYTADVIGVSRQDAKAHTFKPLYGGTTGTDNEKRYYSAFKEKYRDIAKWHEQLQTDAIKYKLVRLPNGREYAFPYAQRQVWGGSSYGTQIKNYPVQGFATADIVPIACINIFNMMKRFKLKSKLINTVHDSIVVDTVEDEIDDVKWCLFKGCEEVIDSLKKRYNIDFNVPLDTDLKMGYDWLNLKEVE